MNDEEAIRHAKEAVAKIEKDIEPMLTQLISAYIFQNNMSVMPHLREVSRTPASGALREVYYFCEGVSDKAIPQVFEEQIPKNAARFRRHCQVTASETALLYRIEPMKKNTTLTLNCTLQFVLKDSLK